MLEFDGPKKMQTPCRTRKEVLQDIRDFCLDIVVGTSCDPMHMFCHIFAFAGIVVYILKAIF